MKKQKRIYLVSKRFYVAVRLAQSRMGLPKSITGVFQGLLLFALLACDTLIHYRAKWTPPRSDLRSPPPRGGAASGPAKPVPRRPLA